MMTTSNHVRTQIGTAAEEQNGVLHLDKRYDIDIFRAASRSPFGGKGHGAAGGQKRVAALSSGALDGSPPLRSFT